MLAVFPTQLVSKFIFMRILFTSIALVLFCWITASTQIEKFSYQPDKVKTGKVFFYKKSNQDGSNLNWVATYISNQTHMESLKWHEGYQGATLVTADMDWSSFSVRKFVGGNISPTGDRIIGGQLDLIDDKGNYQVRFGDIEQKMQINPFPWHSYDFDFASLNLIWPHLKDLKSNFSINIADVILQNNQPTFANKGLVLITYQKEEKRNGVDCYQYNIDGPGLENRGGTIWLSQSGLHFIEYLIDLPDESSYRDTKFQFDRVESMNESEWEQFKLKIARGE